jgi:hypothetical protein
LPLVSPLTRLNESGSKSPFVLIDWLIGHIIV